jgi:cellulose synthase (UDP-forming)
MQYKEDFMATKALVQRQTTVMTDPIFKGLDYPIFTALTVAILATLAYFLVYWFSRRDWMYYPLPFAIMTGGFLLFLFLYLIRWLCLPFMRRPCPMIPRSGWKVGVATTFVPGAESIEMLEETLRGLVAMDYPHETWVLDEGDDDQVKELCRRLGAYHFSRKNLSQYHAASGTFESRSKHGNYNAWLYEIGFDRYEIIVAFDPDHVPNPDFLMNVLGYFDDPEIGYVQAAQVYYNQKASFIARGAAEETYAYYSSIQMTNYTLGYPIVIGCHNTHRVTALKQVGGFAPHAADDLLITVNYSICGWKGVYLPKILAKGLTPVDWSGFLIQQRRWARSVLDIKFWIYPKVARKLPLKERVANFAHGLYYLQSISIGLQIALLAYMLSTGSTPTAFSFSTILRLIPVAIILLLCEFYRQMFFLDPQREVGIHWRSQVLAYAKWPIFLLAIYDVLTRYRGTYTITRKTRATSKHYILFVPHILVVTLIVTSWGIGMIFRHTMHPLLHISSAIIVLSSVGVMLTGLWRFPDPYDPKLEEKEIEEWLAQDGFLRAKN